MIAYKTLMLKIYKPTKSKRELMNSAIIRYSWALQFLLDRYRKNILTIASSEQQVKRSMLLKLIDKDDLKKLNEFDVEPFKDSLKMEFAAMAANFIAQRRRSPAVRYPEVALNVLDPQDAATISDLRAHPVYFGRYAINRDYCLMYDRSTGRFYAKLYLLNAKNKLIGGKDQGRLQLQYIFDGMPNVTWGIEAKRFIIVPLAFGRHQLQDMNRLLENPALAHTARLKKIKGEYYLLVNIECDAPQKEKTVTTLGIVRSASGGLHYTVCDKSENVIDSGTIKKPATECQKLYLLAKSILKVCRRYHPQVVVEGSGGKNDKLLLTKIPGVKPLTTTEYMRFVKILSYKLPIEGLPPPIELSANRLFNSCPVCSLTSQKNRITPRLFICIECGHASAVESVGSLSLIHKLQKYRSNLKYQGKYIAKNSQDNGFQQ